MRLRAARSRTERPDLAQPRPDRRIVAEAIAAPAKAFKPNGGSLRRAACKIKRLGFDHQQRGQCAGVLGLLDRRNGIIDQFDRAVRLSGRKRKGGKLCGHAGGMERRIGRAGIDRAGLQK